MLSRKFILEKIVVALCFIQNIRSLPFKYTTPLIFIFLGLSLTKQKGRPYTPVILFLVFVNTLRSVVDWRFLSILEILTVLLCVYLFVRVRFFEIPTRFGLYERHAKGQSKFSTGYRDYSYGEQKHDIAIYYPTEDKEGKLANWHPTWNYFKTIHECIYIDPRQKKFLPEKILEILTSYLKTYKQNAFLNASLLQRPSYKLIILSHGLASHKKLYSCYAQWWSSRGYIIVTIEHRHDEICVDFLPHLHDVEKVHQFLYDRRNHSLRTRVREFKQLFDQINEGLLDKVFGKNIHIEEIMLVGHSFGGTTVLSAGSQLIHHQLYPKVKRFICLDPWLFPLSEACYAQLHRPILFINTDRFVKTNPEFYGLHEKKHRYSKINKELTKFYVKGMDHLHHSDAIFVFGTTLKDIGAVHNFRMSTFYNQLTIYAMYQFEKGIQGQELIDDLNKEIEKVTTNDPKYVIEDNRQKWDQ